MNKLTKKDLVDSVYSNLNVEHFVVSRVVDEFLLQLKNSISSGAKIELRGLGTFENRIRKGRKNARNPKTGEIFSSASHYVSVFKPGKEIKQAMLNMPLQNENDDN